MAQEVLLYLIRLLEELELDAAYAGLAPGQVRTVVDAIGGICCRNYYNLFVGNGSTQ